MEWSKSDPVDTTRQALRKGLGLTATEKLRDLILTNETKFYSSGNTVMNLCEFEQGAPLKFILKQE